MNIRNTTTVAIIALASVFAVAQTPATKADHRHVRATQVSEDSYVNARLSALDRRFQLTDEQKSKVTAILKDEYAKQNAIAKDTSLTRDKARSQRRDFHRQTHTQLMALLTPEQRERAQAARGNDKGARRLERMSRELNLTDEQKSKLEPIFAEQRKQMEAVRQDSSLTADQRKDKIKQLRADTHKQVLSVLTPEQQKQLRERRSERGSSHRNM